MSDTSSTIGSEFELQSRAVECFNQKQPRKRANSESSSYVVPTQKAKIYADRALVIARERNRGSLDAFPLEILRHIVSFMGPSELAIARGLNTTFKSLVDELPNRLAATLPEISSSLGPPSLHHLTIQSSEVYAIAASYRTISSISVFDEGLKHPYWRTLLEISTHLEQLDLVYTKPIFKPKKTPTSCTTHRLYYTDPWISYAPSVIKCSSLRELHMVVDEKEQTDLYKIVRLVVRGLARQLQVLTVPDVNSLVPESDPLKLELPLLETLTLCAVRPTCTDEYTVHEDRFQLDVPLRILYTEKSQYSVLPSTINVSHYTCPNFVAPKLTSVTIRRARHGAAPCTNDNHRHGYFQQKRLTLPDGLPYHQIKNLTLVEAQLDSWTDLFILGLSSLVTLTVRDATIQNDIPSRKTLQISFGLVQTAVPMWCVTPTLRQLSIVQAAERRDPFPMDHLTLMALSDAFPALERVKLASAVPINRSMSDNMDDARFAALEFICRSVDREAFYLDPFDCNPTMNIEHLSRFQFAPNRSLTVSYRLLPNYSPHTVVISPTARHWSNNVRRKPSLLTEPIDRPITACSRCWSTRTFSPSDKAPYNNSKY